MKKLLLAALGVALIAVPTWAADLGAPIYKAPPLAAPPAYNWTDPYIGVAGGFGQGRSAQTDPGIPCTFFNPLCGTFDGTYSVRGGLAGGTLGYNWQRGPWVFGLEGDYSWADITGSSSVCGASTGFPHQCGTTLESLGTFRGRLVYATGPTGNWLLYATGGLAVGEVHAWDVLVPASGTGFLAGWTAGGGVEVAFARNWTFKVEYLYVDLGSAQLFNVVPGVPETVSFRTNIVRAGLNYMLDWDAPLVARY